MIIKNYRKRERNPDLLHYVAWMSNLWETMRDREAWHAAVHGVRKSQTQRGNWTTIAMNSVYTVIIMSVPKWGININGEWENRKVVQVLQGHEEESELDLQLPLQEICR